PDDGALAFAVLADDVEREELAGILWAPGDRIDGGDDIEFVGRSERPQRQVAKLEAHLPADWDDVRGLPFPVEVFPLAVEAVEPLGPVESIEVAVHGRDELGGVQLMPRDVDGVLDFAGGVVDAIVLAVKAVGLDVDFAAQAIDGQIARPLGPEALVAR